MRIFRELEIGEATDSLMREADCGAHANLAAVRAVVACGGARGGVGKSALLVNIAAALALAGRKVAILDADLNSPSIAAMLGVKAGRRAFVSDELDPLAGPLGLRLFSSELLPEEEPPVSFADVDETPPAAQNGAHPCEVGYLATLRRLLSHSRFGPLDLLLVDLASGIEHIFRFFKLMPRAHLLLFTHSSELSARALRPAIGLASQHANGVIGVIENMAGFRCDGCHQVRPLMPYGAVAARVRDAGAALLERLPFDPRFAETCDRGVIFVREYAQSPLAKQIGALAQLIDKAAQARGEIQAATPRL